MQKEDRAWTEYIKLFAQRYDDSNYVSPLQAKVMRASHCLTEKPFSKNQHFSRVLEVGAGTGEHLPFVKHSFDQYILSDLNPQTLEIASKKHAELHPGKLAFEAQRAETLNYEDNYFDRVVAVHVLEHIYKPHLAIKEWMRVLKEGGTLSILIPTDPGLAWRLGRNLGPRKNAIAKGMAYDYVMAREHVNPCNNLMAFLRHYFTEYTECWWPTPIPHYDFNLFYAFHARLNSKEIG